MKQIARVGNEFVPLDADMKCVIKTATELQKTADTNETNVTAVISKGEHQITGITGKQTAIRTLAEIATLVKHAAENLETDTDTVLDITKQILTE